MQGATSNGMGEHKFPQGRAIVIAGATASGKSALAVDVAERLGGVVINADSMQVYRDLRILTARPSDDDLRRVPHRLFGHIDGNDTYSVGRWLGEIELVLAECRRLGLIPVIVGGTGLYLKALLYGLSDIPPVPEAIRSALRAEAEGQTPEALHARLAALDPAMARVLRPTDPQRILRATEVIMATGRSLGEFQQHRGRPLLPPSSVTGVFLCRERDDLRGRISQRFARMVDLGALEEAGQLAARHLSPAQPVMRALGVAPLLAALRGDVSLDDAVADAATASWRYAKRQITFARHQLADILTSDPDAALTALLSGWRA